MPRELVYASDEHPGYTRRKKGKGFCYYDGEGNKISDEKIISRIKSLGIPPIWSDVWIAKNKNGHLQATGFDQKKRKQYLYHPLWNKHRNEAKFTKMKTFGMALPHIRRTAAQHIQKRGWPKEKVLAMVVQMLDEYHIRIGNEYYKKQNETFGLTTLRRKHFAFDHGIGHLSYKAKSGKYRKIDIRNNQLARLIKRSSELPGYEIFKYQDKEDKKFYSINSHDVNEYLKNIAGEEFTCKDFRTWGGSVAAIETIEEVMAELVTNKRLNLETTIVRRVAKRLGNTVSICRDYYIHPKVLHILTEKKLSRYQTKTLKNISAADRKLLSECEIAVLNII